MSFFGSERLFLLYIAMLVPRGYEASSKRDAPSQCDGAMARANWLAFIAGLPADNGVGFDSFGAESRWNRDWRNQ